MSRGKSFLYGFFVGGVVAGAAALITAQARNGNVLKKTRCNLHKLENIFGDLKSDGKSLKKQIAQSAKEGLQIAKEVAADVNRSIQAWQMEIDPNKKNLELHVKEIKDKLTELEDQIKKERN